jgi:uncharacterized membrane protein YedE/YeeE
MLGASARDSAPSATNLVPTTAELAALGLVRGDRRDHAAASCWWPSPHSLHVDEMGRLYVTDIGNHSAQLLLGASVFGLGWGISGFCPGPSIVALASANLGVIVFVAAMLAGMLAGAKLEQLARR